MLVLETARLEVRHLTLDDAGFVLQLLNEPSFVKNIGDKGVGDLEQAIRYLLAGPMQSYDAHDHGLYRVALKESLAPIGLCGLLKREELPCPDLGYAFLPEFWGRGLAFEAANALLAFEVPRLGLERVVAIVTPGNKDSIRLLDKLGFLSVGPFSLEQNARPVALYEWFPS